MNGYLIAWLVVLVGAVGVLAAFFRLLPYGAGALWRRLLIGGGLAFMLVPAPVPGHPEQLAPAFIVCVFEALFQIDGSPAQSLRILIAGVVVTLLLVVMGHYLIARYFSPVQDALDSPAQNGGPGEA